MAADVRVFAYFVSREAKDVHAQQFGLVEFDCEADQPVTSEHGYWPLVLHALMWIFLSDEAILEEHDEVSRSEQRDTEEEGEFAEIIPKPARIYRQVFAKEELINY